MEQFDEKRFIKDIYECEKYKYVLQERKKNINNEIRKETTPKACALPDFDKVYKMYRKKPIEHVSVPDMPKCNNNSGCGTNFLLSIPMGLVIGGIIGLIIDIIISCFTDSIGFTTPGLIPLFLTPLICFFKFLKEDSDSDRYYNNKIAERENALKKNEEIDRKNADRETMAKKSAKMHIENESKRFEKVEKVRIEKYRNSTNYKLAIDEEAIIDENLNRINATLNMLYNLRINDVLCLHPSYRGLETMSIIFGYFDTGRCSQLRGFDGAYNLYEDEKYKGLIIIGLENISRQLDTLNGTMYYVSKTLDECKIQLSDIAHTNRQIVESMNNANNQLNSINDNISDFKSDIKQQNKENQDRLDLIQNNVKKISYYTKANAFVNAINTYYTVDVNEKTKTNVNNIINEAK